MNTADLGMVILIVYMSVVGTVGLRIDYHKRRGYKLSTELYIAEGLIVAGVLLTLYIHGETLWKVLLDH